MQHDDLKNLEAQAVDLDKAATAKQAADEAAFAASRKRVEDQLRRWDRAMTRAFKGILPAPQRRRMLDKAVSRHGD